MNIKEKIKAFQDELELQKKKAQDLKTEFEEYITNQEIPLMERWDFFIKAPSDVKNNRQYVIRPNSSFLKEWVEDLDTTEGRGRKITIETLCEDWVHNKTIDMENFEDFNQEDIEEALEELLCLNLDYFLLDW